MGIASILGRVFQSKAEKDRRKLAPVVEEIRALRPKFENLSDKHLHAKTAEFRARLAAGETLDDIRLEAFATVWETCRRLTERKATWEVVGQEMVWDMIPFDVQLIGGLALNQGRITEMATGEGKTLVATMPLYLNALEGKGAHLVTVNDYLARRDAEWMGGIYSFLGLSCKCILSEMTPAQRREAYNADITYGTNNEFGFDYLRDNMTVRSEDLVQRGFHFAIVDEVDSVLVDEARTPLIISGPVGESTHRFAELKPNVEKLVRMQTRLLNDYLVDCERHLRDSGGGLDDEHALMMLRASRGGPKMSRFLKLTKQSGIQDRIRKTEYGYMQDKAMWEADKELYYVVEEKQNSVDLTEKGREIFGHADPEFFVLPDLSEELGRIERDESLEPQQKVKKIDELHRHYGERNEGIHNVQQLLKAYTLFEKDDEYVVQDGRIMIVDEFTGRLMSGRRFSDGLHSALEAKEGVRIEAETQTYATVTLQNFFRMYAKLSGMTGTAETEEAEFHQIYGLDVMVIPTHREIQRVDHEDEIYRTKREKYNAIVEDVTRLHGKGLPVLVGTTTVEVSETLSRMLRRKGIPHNVLNAKHHQREAEIVAEAGRYGAVTIATNMAGRGTDIKIAPEVKALEYDEDAVGLHIIGTERHDSRRIDRQLRGRSGRQGDPGASKFFLSLEDDLMRLFQSDRIAGLMDRLGVQEGEVISHPMVTKGVERAQKRVEQHNFSIRKRLLEYDDVMNKQREVIYELRREALLEHDIQAATRDRIEEAVEDLVAEHCGEGKHAEYWDWPGLSLDFTTMVLTPLPVEEDEDVGIGQNALQEELLETTIKAYEAKQARLGEELCEQLERHVSVRTIDELWKDHLHELDMLRSGIGLRAYGQKDPLLEYKAESFTLFEQMMLRLRREVVSRFFRYEIATAPPASERGVLSGGRVQQASARGYGAGESLGAAAGSAAVPAASAIGTGGAAPRKAFEGAGDGGQTVKREMPKVGRNDPCPCGSGKKYKKCHGA
ncbi:MAG TPA: preprotein translocase subunit SecA, partial [Candidatus Krumholzibacteria bacterium]